MDFPLLNWIAKGLLPLYPLRTWDARSIAMSFGAQRTWNWNPKGPASLGKDTMDLWQVQMRNITINNRAWRVPLDTPSWANQENLRGVPEGPRGNTMLGFIHEHRTRSVGVAPNLSWPTQLHDFSLRIFPLDQMVSITILLDEKYTWAQPYL